MHTIDLDIAKNINYNGGKVDGMCNSLQKREHSFSLRKEQKMSRLDTMYNRIKQDLPEFVELIPPTERSEGLYRRIRHIQKTGECCGFKMTIEQLKQIIKLASRDNIFDPICYLCRVLDRLHVEQTLNNISDEWIMDSRLMFVKYNISLVTWQLKYLSDLIRGKYSMDDIVTACEIAMKKQYPDRYFISMFKNGYKRPKRAYNA